MINDPWESLRSEYPWPPERPAVTGPYVDRIHGWLAQGTKAMICSHLPSSGVVVELGTWMGKSAKYMLDTSPAIRLVCIDHWLGSPDINQTRAHREMLPHIFDLCRHHLWPYRDRTVLLRMKMTDGMREVHGAGLQPILVYVDGAHDAKSVEDDICVAATLFPAAVIVGDDWERHSVREGISQAANKLLPERISWNGKAWAMERCS